MKTILKIIVIAIVLSVGWCALYDLAVLGSRLTVWLGTKAQILPVGL